MLTRLSKIARSNKEYCFECGKEFPKSDMVPIYHSIIGYVQCCRKCAAKVLNLTGEY